MMLPVVAIIGRPNVGKSTLFNRITGTKQAITADLAGTTRDRLYGRSLWNSQEFILVDTAGIETGDKKDSVYSKLDTDVQSQVMLALDEADLIVFVVDAQTGVISQDREALKLIQKNKKEFVLAVNKYDSEKYQSGLTEFYKLGVKDFAAISALTGKGTGDLLDSITNGLKNVDVTEKDLPIELSGINVAIAGRPNVGKSSLFNALVGKERAIVSEVAGTTRDYTVATIGTEAEKINFLDTAGIRRRGKVGQASEGKKSGQIEKYSVLRSFQAIDRSDIVLVLIDATEGVTAQDLHIAGYARDQYKGIILVVNKWDAIEKDEKDMNNFSNYLHNKITFLPFAPVIFVSAKDGKNLNKIPDLILEVSKNREKRIKTSELNLILGEDILRKPPTAKRGVLPKVNYITQADINPPTFIFFSSHPELIHFSYLRYLENKIREHWDFTGTAINIVIKRKSEDNKTRRRK